MEYKNFWIKNFLRFVKNIPFLKLLSPPKKKEKKNANAGTFHDAGGCTKKAGINPQVKPAVNL